MKRINIKHGVITFLGLFSFLIFSEGFVAGTLVKTSVGYTAIEQLNIGDSVICFDDDNNCVEQSVADITYKHVLRYARIRIANEYIGVSGAQQLYGVQAQKWIAVEDLKNNNFVLVSGSELCCIKAIEWIDEPVEVYCLTIAEHPNFFVSKAKVCAHNFPPVVIAFGFAFGSGVIEWLGAGVGLAGLGGLYYKFGKKSGNNISLSSVSFSNNMMPDGPEDEDEKKRKRDEARENHHSLTNKEARKLAKDLGYREAKNHPCGNTRNKPVFTNGKEYISPDADGHNGGIWKVFDCKGNILYTMSEYLTDFFKVY